MEVLHSLTSVGVRSGSFSCLGDSYALVSDYSLLDQTRSLASALRLRSRVTVYLPLKIGYGCIKGIYFDLPFDGDGACLLEANDPYFVLATVSGDTIQIFNVQRDNRTCRFGRCELYRVGRAYIYNHGLEWRRPCEMYRVDKTHFCVRINDDQGMILKAQNRTAMRLVPWSPCHKFLDACKTLYSTQPPTRAYIVVARTTKPKIVVPKVDQGVFDHRYEHELHSFRVECVELPWSVTARGGFIAACVL